MKTNGNGWSGKKRCSEQGCRKAAWISGKCARHLTRDEPKKEQS